MRVTAVARFWDLYQSAPYPRLVASRNNRLWPRDASTMTSLVGELRLFRHPLLVGADTRAFSLTSVGTTSMGTVAVIYALE